MKGKFKGMFKYLAQTMIVVYLATFLVSLLVLNYKESRWHAQAGTLSRLQPPYDYLTKFAEGKVPFDRKQLLAYRLFFSQLLTVLRDRPDGYGMLGFCEYHLGNTDKSVEAYKKAIERAPYFIWFHYNLGLIHYQKQDYEKAVDYLSEAVRSNAEVVLRFMLASKVYLDAMATVPNFQQQFPQRLKDGYRDSYKMLVLSYFKLKRFNELVVIADVAVNQKLDDDGFFYYYLGVGAFQAQQFERAALYLREVLEKNPQSAEAYYYLALSFKALDKEDMAVSALQKAEILGQAKGPSYETIKNLRLRIF
jgi:Tfp pilus assembly protein PilF